MSRSPATALSERDVRGVLDVVQRVSQSQDLVSDRYLTLLRTLGEMTGADVALTARVVRKGKRPIEFRALVEVRENPPSQKSLPTATTNQARETKLRRRARRLLQSPGGHFESIKQSGMALPRAEPKAAPSLMPALLEHGAAVSHCITSIYHLGEAGHYAAVVLHRSPPERTAPFEARERQIVELVWQAVGHLHEQPLESPAGQRVRLDRSLLRVLAVLRAKGSLASGAKRLGLSRSEFAVRVRAVYEHYQVRSRQELMAKLTNG